jgi:hypothetical protein
MIITDDNNPGKRLLETGLTYQDKMQVCRGQFVELLTIALDTGTVDVVPQNEESKTISRIVDGDTDSPVPVDVTQKIFDALDAVQPRANTATLAIGDNEITFTRKLPDGTEYVLHAYTFSDEGYQVAHTIVDGTRTVEGFTINVPRACNLMYIATPKL